MKSKKMVEAGKKAWVTRRKNAAKRSQAALKAWVTIRKNKKKALVSK